MNTHQPKATKKKKKKKSTKRNKKKREREREREREISFLHMRKIWIENRWLMWHNERI